MPRRFDRFQRADPFGPVPTLPTGDTNCQKNAQSLTHETQLTRFWRKTSEIADFSPKEI